MTRDELLVEVAELARQYVGLETKLEAETRLVEDLGLDSLKLLTLAIEIENRFEIRLDEAAERAIVTVDDLLSTIEERLE